MKRFIDNCTGIPRFKWRSQTRFLYLLNRFCFHVTPKIWGMVKAISHFSTITPLTSVRSQPEFFHSLSFPFSFAIKTDCKLQTFCCVYLKEEKSFSCQSLPFRSGGKPSTTSHNHGATCTHTTASYLECTHPTSACICVEACTKKKTRKNIHLTQDRKVIMSEVTLLHTPSFFLFLRLTTLKTNIFSGPIHPCLSKKIHMTSFAFKLLLSAIWSS